MTLMMAAMTLGSPVRGWHALFCMPKSKLARFLLLKTILIKQSILKEHFNKYLKTYSIETIKKGGTQWKMMT